MLFHDNSVLFGQMLKCTRKEWILYVANWHMCMTQKQNAGIAVLLVSMHCQLERSV